MIVEPLDVSAVTGLYLSISGGSFGISDCRGDFKKMALPMLVIHSDADGVVRRHGSAGHTHAAIHQQSKRYIIKAGPYGINVSHAEEFNTELIAFLKR